MLKKLLQLGLIPVTVISLQACVGGGEGEEEGAGGIGGGVEQGIGGERENGEGGFGGGEAGEGEED